jgi:hypothetical protein
MMIKLRYVSLAALAYVVGIVIVQGSTCWTGLSKCTLGSNLTVPEIVGSSLALLLGFFAIGVLVALICVAAIYPLRKVKEARIRLVLFLLAGTLIGMLPRLLWDSMWGLFGEQAGAEVFIARLLPWLVAGVGCAFVLTRASASQSGRLLP